jgi:hypothetical protein
MSTRERHYIITLQRMCEDGVMRYTTQYGTFAGHDPEDEAFEQVWEIACTTATPRFEEAGVPGAWTVENTAVLFYRLVDYR